jgi:enoyl-CoA hydratase
MATALDLTLSGREVDAAEAYRLGLVHKVVPHENLLSAAEEYARMILKNSQKGIRSAKETILDIIGRPLDDALRLETINAYSCLGDFQETRERLAAFFAKK